MCIRDRHIALLNTIGSESLQHARMCELNAIEQALNVCETTVVQDAWARGQKLEVHGWVYSVSYTHLDVYKRQHR